MLRMAFAYIWASPNTVFGFLGALLARVTGGGWQLEQGVLESWGGIPAWLLKHATLLPSGVAAITFGHVVLGRSREDLHRTRVHERVHVQQYGRLGIFFLPAYVLASVWGAMRGKGIYMGNVFEREAFRIERVAKESQERDPRRLG